MTYLLMPSARELSHTRTHMAYLCHRDTWRVSDLSWRSSPSLKTHIHARQVYIRHIIWSNQSTVGFIITYTYKRGAWKENVPKKVKISLLDEGQEMVQHAVSPSLGFYYLTIPVKVTLMAHSCINTVWTHVNHKLPNSVSIIFKR